jgi:hypothetical protein
MPTLDQAVAGYIKLRDRKKEIVDEHKEVLAPYNEKLLKLENWIQHELQSQGATNVKTGHGTAYLSTTTRPKVEDWNAFLDHIRANDLWSLLERRPCKQAVDEYIEGSGEVPPGVSIKREVNARVRR